MKKLLKMIRNILICILVLAISGLGLLTYKEYQPANKAIIPLVQNSLKKEVSLNQEMNILTWNIGYGALGEQADFFMDGGKSVQSSTKESVQKNLIGIQNIIKNEKPDFALFQEVDYDSKRSYYINEQKVLSAALPYYSSSSALNFKAFYVPYPLPPIGRVNSGIETYSAYRINSSLRYQLPIPFKWPSRTVNLKRCLTLNRINIKNTEKQLVIINLHLEAFDKGEGKKKQTEAVKKLIEDEYKKGNYVIAGGDFNQTFTHISLQNYPRYKNKWQPGTIDTSVFKGFNCVMDNTYPTARSLDKAYRNKFNHQYYMIDGYMVSKNITIKKIETKNYHFKYSDHNPVKLTFLLNSI